MNSNTKSTKSKQVVKNNSNTKWTKVSKGVYSIGKYYAVRKMIDGTKTYTTFTNKAKAIAYYSSLSK